MNDLDLVRTLKKVVKNGGNSMSLFEEMEERTKSRLAFENASQCIRTLPHFSYKALKTSEDPEDFVLKMVEQIRKAISFLTQEGFLTFEQSETCGDLVNKLNNRPLSEDEMVMFEKMVSEVRNIFYGVME